MNSTAKLLALLAILLTSCAAPRVAQDYQRDSVVRIVRDSVTLRDTVVLVQVPEGSDRAVLPETDTSRLSTSVAESEAYVSNGKLHHRLWNRSDIMLPVRIQYTDRARVEQTSQIANYKIVETVEVEKPLNWWQKFVMTLGYLVIAVVITWSACMLWKRLR